MNNLHTASNSRFDEIRASANLPSPRGVALQVIQLTHKDDVTNQEIALAIKPDPALSSRIIKVANARVAYQTQPVVSVVDAVSVLGLNTVRQLVLGLSLMDSSRNVVCQKFDYQSFWAHSLLTAITAQNLVLLTGAGSSEKAFLLGLLGQVGTLALATVCPQEYARILGAVATQMDPELANLERAEFGFDHNQLTQAMLENWGMPQVFQEIALHHENPGQASFTQGSRDWCLLNVLHIADYCSRTCLVQGPQRRKMIPKLILITNPLGVELDALAKLGDKSVCEWHEWSKLCGMRSAEVPHFAELLAAVPLTPDLLEIGETLPGDAGVFYKLRILLVNDEQDALLALKTLLEKAGHTVLATRNKVEALGLLEEYKPQLIIADWGMPEIGGIELCRALRQNPLWRDTYVLILAAQESTDRLVEAFDAGANDYITRPVNFKELGARLHAAQRVVQLREDMQLDRQQLHKITDELAAFNQRLRKSDVNMRAILDNSPYMAWLKDAEGRYIKVNKAYADYVRLKNVQQVIGKTDFDLWPKAMAEKYRADDDEIMALRQKKHIEESSFDGDRMHWVETYKTPVIDENGNVLGTTGFARDITERKQAEDALRRSEAKLHTLYNSTSDAVMLLDEKGFFDCNMATLAMFGCATKEEFCSKHPADLSPPKQPCGTNSMTLANRQIAMALKNGSNFFEWLHKRADTGNIFPADVLLNSMELDGKKTLQATVRDTTERKLAEVTLRESKERLHATIEASMDAVVQMNAEGIITGWNSQMEEIFGWPRIEAIGRALHETIIPTQHREAHVQGLKHFLHTGIGPILNTRVEIFGLHRDGHEFPIELTISPIKMGGKYEFSAFIRDITKKKKSEEIIWNQANFDTLTSLPNRRMFRDRMEQEIRKTNRAKLPLALMFIDLDHFKEINDTLGHDMGDLLLVEAARRISDCVRATDIVARLGGDEFTVLMAEIDDIGSVERVAACITQKLASPFRLRDEVSHVSASIGITLYPNDADTIEGLFKNADQAMYASKNKGRNCHSYFTHAMQEAAQTKMRLVNDLRDALAADQFMVYFQPIVDMATGRINKAEALVRWQHPGRGLVSPAEFIPLAEETGLILEIGDWVFHESMRWVKHWRALYNPLLQISVNKSPVQFYKDGDEHAAWLTHLKQLDLPGQSLAIEITEGLLMGSNASVTNALYTLRDAGIQVSMDDFGTGYSSLSYLKKFDIDYLKIDQSFIRGLSPGSSDMALSEAIIVMAHKLGIKVVAEGVETKEQRELLAAAGCDYAQGYLYSRPVPPDEFEVLLKDGLVSAMEKVNG